VHLVPPSPTPDKCLVLKLATGMPIDAGAPGMRNITLVEEDAISVRAHLSEDEKHPTAVLRA